MTAKDPVLLGIDLGTSGCTALALGLGGHVLASSSAPYPLLSPKPGWAEQRASDWWAATIQTARDCQARLEPDHQEIVAIGVDSHLEAFVPLDSRGNALANGLTWLDQRTVPQAEQLRRLLDEAYVIDLTGVPINYVTPATKLLWLKQNDPDAYERAEVFLCPKDYVNYKLTGVPRTDYSIASKTMLFELRSRQWNEMLCRESGLDVKKLPVVQGAWEVVGHTSAEFAALTGIKAGVPVAGGGGDDHCQAFGVGAIEPGIINIGTGTGSCWQSLITSPRSDPTGRLECHCNVLPATWIHWAAIAATGYAVEWFTRNFGIGTGEEGLARFEALAAKIKPGAEGLYFYPYLWGARTPRFNPHATGVFFGITHSKTIEHFCRAILEGIAFQFHSLLGWLADVGVEARLLTMVGGETNNRLWNQIKADVVGQPILIPEIGDAAAVGAAMLGGIAVGLYENGQAAVRDMVRYRERVKPGDDQASYERIYEDYRVVYDMIEPAYSARPIMGE